MGVEIMMIVWNRREYTRQAMHCLRNNTDWSLVTKLVIYDDGSEDGAGEVAREFGNSIGVPSFDYRDSTHLNAPAAYMNDFVATCEAPLFVKLDNDIAVPPGWLNVLYDVMGRNPSLELLGMEYGQTFPGPPAEGEQYMAMPCRHIGGVGMMRTQGFLERPPLMARGRSGWTEHQHRYSPRRGWLTPDLPVVHLDRMVGSPWETLRQAYIEKGWMRNWGPYDPVCPFWDWMDVVATEEV